MKLKYLLIFGAIMLLLIPFISAFNFPDQLATTNPCGNPHSFLGVSRQNSNIDLWQNCDNCSYVNLTNIKTPTTNYNFNSAMTKNGTNYNYITNITNTLGCHSYTICGDKGGSFICETIDFEITPSGKESISIALVMILFLGSVLFGFLSWFFHREVFLHILFLFSSLIILLYAINQLYIPILFFTTTVVVLMAFVYYIINYIRETMDSVRERKGFEY